MPAGWQYASGLAIRQRNSESGIRAIDLDDLDGLTAALHPRPDGHPSAERLTRLINVVTGLAPPDFSRNLIDPRRPADADTVHARPGRHVALHELADRVALTPSRLGAPLSPRHRHPHPPLTYCGCG